MPAAERMILTIPEAVRAVRIDLGAYGPQEELYARICALLAGKGEGAAAAASLEDALAALDDWEPTPRGAAALCALVFETRARAVDGAAGAPAVCVDTGMEEFACTRCGRCCLALDFHLECTAADVDLWRRLGREDILAWVGEETGPDGGVAYRIWQRPGTPFYAEACPWLRRVPGDRAFVCTIQDVKPDICRSYPGLRKHALMTGCRGFGSA